ncbi:MAG TPA: L,D-transpeptidase [Sphingomicrobium sp.]|nr:L,D-transpeptidase [Sphingomicrobium sp.]
MRFAFITAALLLAASPGALAAQDSVSLSLPESVPSDIFSGSRSKDVLVAQVLLDRSRFSPGVIDGYTGENTRRAIRAFQRANGMEETGKVSSELLEKLSDGNADSIVQTYTISDEDVGGPFVDIPSSMTAMAKLDHLAYETPLELLAEKFHMDQEFLKALNPGADFGKAGTKINVIAPGDEDLPEKVARIEIDKANESVRAYSEGGKLLARYPATIGSSTFPSPSGTVQVKAIAADPKYYFDPEGRDWGPDEKLTIAAGPNNPIGGTWIDLSKEGYGIHGSPDPSKVGKRASHGCVRLTNWDASELARAVNTGATVEFI